MAQWNLSVDLRGRDRNLGQTLRNNAARARDLGSAIRDAQGNIRDFGLAARTARNRVRGLADAATDATGNLRQLGNRADRAARRMRRLADEIQEVEARLAALNGDVRIAVQVDDQTGGTALALRQVQDAAQDTARALRTLRGRAAATAAAFDDLRARALLAAGSLRSLNTAARGADGRLDTLNGRARTLHTSVTELNGALGRTGSLMGGLQGRIGTVGNATGNATVRTRQLMVAAVALGTALLPVAAATAPIAAGLTAAGVAAGVFGVAIAGQIKALTDAAEAQNKYDEAVREHGPHSAEAAKAELEQVRILKDMPAATREAAAAYEVLTEDYKAFSNSLAGDTMPVATKSMAIFSRLLEDATPLAKGASREVNRFMTIVGGGLASEEFDEFMNDFTTFAVETLARANSGIVRLSRGLNTGEIGSDLREFMAYARQNGPLVADALSNLFSALMKIVAAASDVGVSMLTVVNVFAQLINAIPTDTLATLLQVAVAFKAIQLAGLAVGVVAPVMAALATNTSRFVRAARFGGVTSALAGVTQQLTAMQRASVALAVLTVVVMGISHLADESRGAPPEVDKLTTSLKNLATAGKFAGELQKTFGDVDGLVGKIGKLDKASKGIDDYVKRTSIGIDAIDDLRRKIRGIGDDLINGEDSFNALTDDFKGLDEAMAQLVTSGHADVAAKDFDMIAAAAKREGRSVDEVRALLPGYQAALDDVAAEQEITARSMGVFGAQAQETKQKLDAQKASADGLRAAIQALNDVNRAALGGMIGFEQAIDDAAEAAKKNAGALTMTGGQLDLNSQKARTAASALQELGTKTDEAAAAARESGASWKTVNGIYDRGRTALINTAIAMGLQRGQAIQLAESILNIPDEHTTRVEMDRADALAGLDAVIAKIRATPGAKSVTVRALTKEAMALLNTLGYTTKTLPDGRVEVVAKTGTALTNIAAVQRARDALQDRTITITTRDVRITESIHRQQTQRNVVPYANGGLVAHAADGLFVPGYAPRVDTVPAVLSPGEGVLVPETVRKLAAAAGMGEARTIKALNSWGRYGTAMQLNTSSVGPQRFADGGITRHAGGSIGSSPLAVRDAMARYSVGMSSLAPAHRGSSAGSGDTYHFNVSVLRTDAPLDAMAAQVGRQVRRARRGGVASRG
ncbi:hypothetical protein [Streptomyces sp. NPDC006551]|uniref:hypothetical protein n=1 Tax=Streptomyces sp. NPDC006551 TaxID=3157178 RepID=UPI0033A7CA8F